MYDSSTPPVLGHRRPAFPRVIGFDLARTAALAAMIAYHTVFDLEMFGYLAPGAATTGGWRFLALCTAGSFLFLAGVSLGLAHANGVRWRAFWRGIVRIAGAAGLVTIVTYIAVPHAFIFFGILHAIVAARFVGIVLWRMPDWVLWGVAIFVVWASFAVRPTVFTTPALWWVGLHEIPIQAMDYVPIFPWLGPFLIGVAVARTGARIGVWDTRARGYPSFWVRLMSWPGRHSLAIYLIHQPILIGIIWGVTVLMP